MIKCVLIINNQGKPRLSRFYYPLPVDQQQRIQKALYCAVSKRSDELACAFADDEQGLYDEDHKIIYRHYATLYFIFVVDSAESELGVLDLIYHFDRVNFILDELVIAGMVLETNADLVIQ